MGDRYQDVKEVFEAAVEKSSPGELVAYLQTACDNDADLRTRVETLLAAHRAAGEFLEPVAVPPDTTIEPAPITEAPGTIIGRYKLLELIGEGGFGDVYMAEQQEPVRRKVALKVIKLGMDTRAVITRFEAERQALALMDHPNIAKVLDAGATESGRPYFVMDLVRGFPITEYCDANNLTPEGRLSLFIDVCQAVQHAHQKGIIHRDLKPTNVMVTLRDTKPVPKIIDFGVAKSTQQRLTEKTLFTEHRQLVGTPEYMSPEQATFGEADVDTRSDIYSLGVLLYELLVGTTPFDVEALRSHGYDEICRVIRESDPPTPSKRLSTLGDAVVTDISKHRHVEPAALRKLLRGDLDWIVMKALEKDRTRRYETVHGLARDIERHLSDEPVRARPPSMGYRLKKFVRKYRTPVVAAAVVFAVVIIGLAVALAREQQLRVAAEEQRNRAGENLRQAQQVVDEFLTRLSTHPEFIGSPRTKQLRAELLERARDYYRDFIKQEPRDPALRHELAAANMRLGATCLELGKIDRPDKALPACQEAINIFQRLANEKPTDVEVKALLAQAYNALGIMQALTANYDRAEAAYDRALKIARRLEEREVAGSEFGTTLGGIYCNLGHLAEFRGQYEAALESYRQAIQLQNEVLSAVPEDRTGMLFLCSAHAGRGETLRKLGHHDAAIESFEKALGVADQLIRDDPDMEYACGCVTIYNNLACAHQAKKEWDRALPLLQRAMAIGERLVDENPALPALMVDLGGAYCNVARAMFGKGEIESAQSFNRKARTTLEKALQSEPNRRGELFLSNSLRLEADIWRRLGRPQEALASHQHAARVLDQLVEADPATADYTFAAADCFRSLVQVCCEMGRWDEALNACERSVELQEALLRKSPQIIERQIGLGESFYNIGAVYRALGRQEESQSAYQRAIEIFGRAADDDFRDARYRLSLAHNNLGVLYKENRRWQEAFSAFEQAREFQERLLDEGEEFGDLAAHLGGTYCNLANLAAVQGELDGALEWFDQAISTLNEALSAAPQLPITKSFLVNALRGRAATHEQLSRHAEAASDWQQAAEMDVENGELRFRLAASLAELARAGNHRQAVRRAASLEADSTDSTWLYNLACVYALAVAATAQDDALSDEEPKRLVEAYGAEATRLLRSIRTAGGFREARGVELLETDQDLDAIRTREDFRGLMEEIRQSPPVPPRAGSRREQKKIALSYSKAR